MSPTEARALAERLTRQYTTEGDVQEAAAALRALADRVETAEATLRGGEGWKLVRIATEMFPLVGMRDTDGWLLIHEFRERPDGTVDWITTRSQDQLSHRLEAAEARVAELERERERTKAGLAPLHDLAAKLAPVEVWGQNVAKWAADRIEAAEERAARLQAENDELRADLKHVQDATGRVPVRHVTYEDGPGLTWKDALEKTQAKLAAAEAQRDRIREMAVHNANALQAIADGKTATWYPPEAFGDAALSATDGGDAPEICSQCGEPFSARACGPTHAVIAAERGLAPTGEAP